MEKNSDTPNKMSGPADAEVHRTVASVWDSHLNQSHRRDISHWRGVGRWANTDTWEKVGQKHLMDVRILLQNVGRSPALEPQYTILEWGPGGGTNLLALSSIAKKLYAVDISTQNLEESGRILLESGYSNYQPILLKDDIPSALSCIDEVIDIFISTAVFQHFPSKEYGLEVLNSMGRRMQHGGVGMVQIRYDNGNPHFISKPINDYEKHYITATSYPIDEFWNALVRTGFEPFMVKDISSQVNYATFGFYKK